MMKSRIALLGGLALAACGPAGQTATTAPLQGAAIGGPFALTDHNARSVTDRDFAGRYRIMYFGYTFCPDVCPTDMQTIAAGLKLVEAEKPGLGRRIVPVFVTIDPARDTPAVLKAYVTAFHPRLVGLTGPADRIAALEKSYAVFAAKGAETAGGYLMEHSRQAYLMDPSGRPLALLPQDGTPEQVAAEIERWAI